jgi:hypothetical protein
MYHVYINTGKGQGRGAPWAGGGGATQVVSGFWRLRGKIRDFFIAYRVFELPLLSIYAIQKKNEQNNRGGIFGFFPRVFFFFGGGGSPCYKRPKRDKKWK